MQPDGSKADSIRAALARGDLLAAYDEVTQGKEPGHRELDYLEVLTLARLGDTEQSLRLYSEYRIDAMGDVDALSLKARLLKDQAFAAGARPSRDKLLEACGLYSGVYRQTRSNYPAINAATLAQIAGRTRLASGLARAVAKQCVIEARSDYFSLATYAEALLILGDVAGAREALVKALAAPDADAGARSTTVLQLQRLAATAADPEGIQRLLDLVRPPKVAMFCGNIFLADAAIEANLATRMSRIIAQEQVGFAYGALAAGSDILIAEQLLASGAELNVVLPFAEADFIERSVAPAGGLWLKRYHACKAKAASVAFASHMSYVDGGDQFAYGSKVAMGLTRLRARHLKTAAVQLAIVEGAGSGTLSGSDIDDWRATGGQALVVAAGRLERPPSLPPPPRRSHMERGTYGLMFMDYPGFAALDERVLPIFYDEVMVRTAEVLKRYEGVTRETNSWGDAVFVVFDDATSAAAAALDMCEQFLQVDCEALGVPQGTAMRVALHYGPTYVGHDPVRRGIAHYGTEVSRAARIEPVTPSGSVYVTESFAAVLEMDAPGRFVCNYVGKVSLAKGYGIFPIYGLTRSPAVAEAQAAAESEESPLRAPRRDAAPSRAIYR
jgi:adenylate cyclase